MLNNVRKEIHKANFVGLHFYINKKPYLLQANTVHWWQETASVFEELLEILETFWKHIKCACTQYFREI